MGLNVELVTGRDRVLERKAKKACARCGDQISGGQGGKKYCSGCSDVVRIEQLRLYNKRRSKCRRSSSSPPSP